jgi:tetratricopeptide (TPR) repeat protein
MEPGSRVLHYELTRRLGAGGMGEVFLARDTVLHRPVAIKFLLGPASDRGRARLLQEARAAAALEHSNICAIYEIGADPVAGDFIVMQYVEGETLSSQTARGPLPPARAVGIAAEIAAALAEAHGRGLIHRDLKPQNVMITPGGGVKLLDFGLAKQLADAPGAAEAPTASALTGPGASPGTPGYMAPEQVRAGHVDARADLFALGCVLYECLTGRRAFTGATNADIAAAVLHVDPPPPSTIVPGLTAEHDALCARLLARPVEARFQSAREVLDAIRRPGDPAAARGARASRRLPWGPWGSWGAWGSWGRVVIVAGIAMLAIVVIAIAGWFGSRRPAPPADVARLYDDGVEAIRDGQYVVAGSLLSEAVTRFPALPAAYSRLAEAHSELDQESHAMAALLRVDELVRDLGDLPREERLRVEAIRSFVLRQYDDAAARYLELAELRPDDPGRWVDVGRADEAAGRPAAALGHYERAVGLNPDYAAAHLRLGSLRAQTLGQLELGVASLDEAGRLYALRQQAEGEAEALLRKGILFTAVGRFDEARTHLTRVLELTGDPRFLYQRVRAQFDLARLTVVTGAADQGEAIAGEAVQAAIEGGLWGSAANGQVDLGNAILSGGDAARADAALSRAVALATDHGARRTELRARAALASARVQLGKPAEAIALVEASLADMRPFPRLEVQAKSILARAHEDLEQYDQAAALSADVLRFAESIGDDQQIATALNNIASQLTKRGQLPEALAARERREEIIRRQKNDAELPFDVISRVELLIRLGRGGETEPLLEEFDRRVREAAPTFVARQHRPAVLRAMRAATEGRSADVLRHAAEARALAPRPDGATRLLELFVDYALAASGRGRPASDRAEPIDVGSPAAREARYWEARAALARRDHARAFEVAHAAWGAPGAAGNVEAQWRLAAIAAAAGSEKTTDPQLPDGASMPGHATAAIDQLTTAWAEAAAATYFRRHDLATLRQLLASKGTAGGSRP